MEWWLVLLVIFLSLLASFATGIPIAFAFLALDIVGLFLARGGSITALTLLPGSIFDSTTAFVLIAIPMFYLLGEVLLHSGVINMLMDTVDKWVGGIRARLLLVCLVTGTGLAALSGAGAADTALLGSTLFPSMEERGYDRRLSIGVITSSGLLAALIPPSALAVLMASIAQTSAGKLLIGGLIPGLLIAGIISVYILVRTRINPDLAPSYPSSGVPLSDKLLSTAKLAPLGIIVFAVMGFIILGIATPSEAAATGALASIVVTALYGRFNLRVLMRSLDGVMRVTGMLLLIIAGAKGFGQLLALTGASQAFFQLIVGLSVPHWVILVAIQFAALFLGLFMDVVAIMLIAIPIVTPIVSGFGWDPTWFYVLFLMNITVGLQSPPFGLALFTFQGVAQHIPIKDIFRAQIPFLAIDITAMILVMAFPQIALWLPAHMSG